MTGPAELRVVSDDGLVADAGPPVEAAPTVFVRTIAAPPGAPWDQARMAGLEARVGAPLPLADVVYQVRRLEPWRFGQPGRFAACYVRAREAGEDFEAVAQADGKPLKVRFLSPVLRARRARLLAAVAAGGASAALLALSAVGSAIHIRADLARRLDGLEQTAAVQLREAKLERRSRDQARALLTAHVAGHTLDDMLGDLAWASANKIPGAHIDSVHWEPGFMGVTVRGDGRPFGATDRSVAKIEKPVRPGLWLWGVGPLGRGGDPSNPQGAAKP